MKNKKQETINELLNGNGFIIARTDDGFGVCSFGEWDIDTTCMKIAECMSVALKMGDNPHIEKTFIELLGIVSFCAMDDTQAYRTLKGALEIVQQKRNKVADDMLKGLED